MPCRRKTIGWRPGATFRWLDPARLSRGDSIRPRDRQPWRIDIDLPKALREHCHETIIPAARDSIRIPEISAECAGHRRGEFAGSVLFRKGAGLDYYLSASGGFTRAAEKGQVSVHYANGEVRTKHRTSYSIALQRRGLGRRWSFPSRNPNAPRTDTVALFGRSRRSWPSTVAIIVVVTRH